MPRREFDQQTLMGKNMDTSSVNSLRLKSEQSRARLKETMGQLNQALSDTSDDIKTTFSSEHLKEEVRAYAKKRQASVVHAVRGHVTNHPLEALAIGAVVSYPLLGLLKKVPVPLVLIGAGLLLARKGNGTSRSTEQPEDEGRNTSEEGLGQELRAGLKDAQDSIMSTGATAVESLAGMAHSAVSGMQTKVQDFAASATKSGKDTSDSLASLVERNPLLAGGLAVAVGGLIAASLPGSRIEDQLLGQGRGVLKDSVRRAAESAVRGAEAEASKIVEDISVAARDTGLTSEALDQTVDTVVDKIASVADRAVDAAIGAKSRKAETENTSDGDENAKL